MLQGLVVYPVLDIQENDALGELESISIYLIQVSSVRDLRCFKFNDTHRHRWQGCFTLCFDSLIV